MRLLYDARHAAFEFTGLARYATSLLEALIRAPIKSSVDLRVLLFKDKRRAITPAEERLVALLQQYGHTILYVPIPAISLRQHVSIAHTISEIDCDEYFYPHFDLPLGVRCHAQMVVHDLTPLKVPGYITRFGQLKRHYFGAMLQSSLRRADRCIAVSHNTKRDLVELAGHEFSSKIIVAPEGPTAFADLGRADASSEPPFLLYVGDRRPHKNLRRIVDLFTALRAAGLYSGELVLAGSTQNFDFDLDRYIQERSGIRVLGKVAEDELGALYRRADAILFLSTYEGFGLPVVEASQYGKKIVISDTPALMETAPSWALVLPNAQRVADAAQRVGTYLRSPYDADVEGYLAHHSWSNAARIIFSRAFQAANAAS